MRALLLAVLLLVRSAESLCADEPPPPTPVQKATVSFRFIRADLTKADAAGVDLKLVDWNQDAAAYADKEPQVIKLIDELERRDCAQVVPITLGYDAGQANRYFSGSSIAVPEFKISPAEAAKVGYDPSQRPKSLEYGTLFEVKSLGRAGDVVHIEYRFSYKRPEYDDRNKLILNAEKMPFVKGPEAEGHTALPVGRIQIVGQYGTKGTRTRRSWTGGRQEVQENIAEFMMIRVDNVEDVLPAEMSAASNPNPPH